MSNYECPHCQPDDQCIWCREASLESRVEKLSHENEDLRAEVERLTRDLAEAQRKCADLQAVHDADCDMALELVELRRKCGEWAPYVDHAGCPRVAAEMWEEAEK